MLRLKGQYGLSSKIEGVGLKQNNQSTTHIDPQVGTGGMVRVYY